MKQNPLSKDDIAELVKIGNAITEEEKKEKHIRSEPYYDSFIRKGLSVGFTDDQIDFLWDWITHFSTEAFDKALEYFEPRD